MPETRKQRLTREALGDADSGTPFATGELTPRIAYIGLVLLVVATITGGNLRMEGDVPLPAAERGATSPVPALPAPAAEAQEGNVVDLTY